MIIDAGKFYEKYKDKDSMIAVALLMTFVSVVFLVLIVRVMIPADIITTALGYATMVQPVITTAPTDLSGAAQWFVTTTHPVTFEGLALGMALFLAALLFAFDFDRRGDWVKGQPMSFYQFLVGSSRGMIPPALVNREKVRSFTLFLLVESVDVLTDVAWRWKYVPGDAQSSALNMFFAVFMVLIFNFVLSEVATAVSIQTIFASVMFIWREYIGNLFTMPGKNRSRGDQKQRGYNPQPQNQGKQHGHQPPSNYGQPGRQQPPQQGQRQPQNGHGQRQPYPQNGQQGQRQRQPQPQPPGQPYAGRKGIHISMPQRQGYPPYMAGDDIDDLLAEFEG